MADQWKGRVITIADRPVAIVDVTITRTLLIDASAYERLGHILRSGEGDKSGLKEVDDFYTLARGLPPESRRFVVAPWTDAESKKIGLRSFAEILRVFDKQAYWRVEGSAAESFRGYLNLGGQDRIVDLSEAAIPQFLAQLDQTRQEAATALAAGEITQEQKDAIDEVCNRAGPDSVACQAMYRAHAEMLKERERSKREQMERGLRDREREQNGSGSRTGDFPGGWGGRFSDTA
jgi:hypothetical protein